MHLHLSVAAAMSFEDDGAKYDSFKRQIAAIGGGDLTLMERMMALLSDCMPQDARDFYGYIFKYIMNPDSVKNDQTAFSQYDQLAAACIFQHALIKMDLATGQIEETDAVRSDFTIIRADDFEQTATMMPQSMKCVLNDLWKEIQLSLRDCHTHGGQQKDCRTLDELLIGDKEHLKTLIKDFLYENPGASRLAYLLYALRQSGHIESCNYLTFHRALQSISTKPLGGLDVPQRRFHELMADPKLLDSKGKKWQQAKSIIGHWTVLFLK